MKGFTLIELIMAVFILAIGMFAVARMNPTGQRAAVVTKERLIALRVARNVLDQARCQPFGSDCKKLEGPVALAAEMVEGNPVGQEFFVTQVAVSIPPQPAGQLTKVGYGTINVTVAWRDVGGTVDPSNSTKSVTLTGGISREP